MNSFSALLVALVAALAVTSVRADNLPADFTDRFLEGLKVVWAGPGDATANFEETQAAMQSMLAEMNKREYRADIDKNPRLAATRAKLTGFLDACKLEKSKCLSIFGNIDLMFEDEPEDAINLVPYLRECEQRQTDFCSGRDPSKKPNKGANFFEKVVTACWSKKGDKKDCEKKN